MPEGVNVAIVLYEKSEIVTFGNWFGFGYHGIGPFNMGRNGIANMLPCITLFDISTVQDGVIFPFDMMDLWCPEFLIIPRGFLWALDDDVYKRPINKVF